MPTGCFLRLQQDSTLTCLHPKGRKQSSSESDQIKILLLVRLLLVVISMNSLSPPRLQCLASKMLPLLRNAPSYNRYSASSSITPATPSEKQRLESWRSWALIQTSTKAAFIFHTPEALATNLRVWNLLPPSMPPHNQGIPANFESYWALRLFFFASPLFQHVATLPHSTPAPPKYP
jgi:hypothetical protein